MNQQMQVLTSNNTVEWYSPKSFIEDVKKVLTEIDLDPASTALPQNWICARKYFDKETNGLTKEWFGKIYLNPPYGKTNGKSNQSLWAQKLISEYEKANVEEAILLINSNQGYKWYEQIYRKYAVCLVSERFRFINETGEIGGQAKKGQTIVYFGKYVYKFADVFKDYGRILLPDFQIL